MQVDSETTSGREPEQTAQSLLNVIKELVKYVLEEKQDPAFMEETGSPGMLSMVTSL